ncbi:hypothetical protein R3P38DRAFT_3223018 [Favolaschia claudopus]|uniref:Uncharacterized protein n=1 Tax=Favolaschia claudopus TaxID=2862362 RepID=A0AAV9ZXN3_9AGAR
METQDIPRRDESRRTPLHRVDTTPEAKTKHQRGQHAAPPTDPTRGHGTATRIPTPRARTDSHDNAGCSTHLASNPLSSYAALPPQLHDPHTPTPALPFAPLDRQRWPYTNTAHANLRALTTRNESIWHETRISAPRSHHARQPSRR